MSRSDRVRGGKLTASRSAVVEKNRRNKKAFILETAERLFAEFGYHGTSMDMLSEKTGLNKGTLYYYYSTKPDILFDICVTSTEKLYRTVSAASKMSDPTEALDFFIEESVHYIVENRAKCQIYYQEDHFFGSIFDKKQLHEVRQQQKAFMRTLYSVIDRGIACGQFRAIDVRTGGRLIYGTILGPYRWRDPVLDSESIVGEMRGLLVRGIGA